MSVPELDHGDSPENPGPAAEQQGDLEDIPDEVRSSSEFRIVKTPDNLFGTTPLPARRDVEPPKTWIR